MLGRRAAGLGRYVEQMLCERRINRARLRELINVIELFGDLLLFGCRGNRIFFRGMDEFLFRCRLRAGIDDLGLFGRPEGFDRMVRPGQKVDIQREGFEAGPRDVQRCRPGGTVTSSTAGFVPALAARRAERR